MFLAFKSCNSWRKLCTFSRVVQQADILVLGGNGFIGSECVRALLEKGHKLTLVNRGREHFDYSTRIKPFVTEIICDRSKGLGQCEKFQKLEKYDFVIDFSSKKPNDVKDSIRNLKEKFSKYIFISSSSVYEVCPPSEDKKSKEIDVKWGSFEFCMHEDDRINQKYWKLQCEETLKIESEKEEFKYLVFRLPDVIGPRDTSLGFWTYQTWFEYHASSDEPLYLPKSVESAVSSYVYVKDVAKVITDVVEKFVTSQSVAPLYNKAYNLAFPEEFTLRTLLDGIRKVLGTQDVEYIYREYLFALLPSFTSGPLDITRATKELEFKPTPWLQAFEETIDFNTKALHIFRPEAFSMMYHILGETVAHLNNFYMIVDKFTDERAEIEEKAAAAKGKTNMPNGDKPRADL